VTHLPQETYQQLYCDDIGAWMTTLVSAWFVLARNFRSAAVVVAAAGHNKQGRICLSVSTVIYGWKVY
jgi:hypothetical protein